MVSTTARPPVTALLLMGGGGTRFGTDTPKQFQPLAGKRVYLHTLETFLDAALFEEILLIVPQEWESRVQQDLQAYPASLRVITGGATRQESAFLGLLQCNPSTQFVVIHDAVRPLVSLDILQSNVQAVQRFHAVDTCISSADTLVYSPSRSDAQQIPLRSHYLRGQTPQSFSFPLLLAAHKKAKAAGDLDYSDDCALVLKTGHPIHIVEGSEENIKITTELDLYLAEHILRLKQERSPSASFFSLQGKKIAVAGGAGGIGAPICALLEKEGAHPLVLSRSAPVYKADLTSFAETQTVFNALYEQEGPLDGLINSVGYLKTGPLKTLSEQDISTLITTNLTSAIYCCKCAHIREGGHILNISSSSYIRGKGNYAIYSSAKAALVNFTQGLAEERRDLFVNVLAPQRTRTPLRLANFPDEEGASLLDPNLVAKQAVSILKQRLTGCTVSVRRTTPL